MKDKFLVLNKSKFFNYDKESFKFFLAGFIEGDGSLSVAIKSQPKLKFGFALDPEFSIYQHVSGILLLEAAKNFFRAGSINKKAGDSDVYVFRINNRTILQEKVIPYFNKYVVPYSCKYSFFYNYKYIVDSLIEKKHKDFEGFMELLEKAYALNENSKGKERKYSYEEIKEIILRDYTPNKGISS